MAGEFFLPKDQPDLQSSLANALHTAEWERCPQIVFAQLGGGKNEVGSVSTDALQTNARLVWGRGRVPGFDDGAGKGLGLRGGENAGSAEHALLGGGFLLHDPAEDGIVVDGLVDADAETLAALLASGALPDAVRFHAVFLIAGGTGDNQGF